MLCTEKASFLKSVTNGIKMVIWQYILQMLMDFKDWAHFGFRAINGNFWYGIFDTLQ